MCVCVCVCKGVGLRVYVCVCDGHSSEWKRIHYLSIISDVSEHHVRFIDGPQTQWSILGNSEIWLITQSYFFLRYRNVFNWSCCKLLFLPNLMPCSFLFTFRKQGRTHKRCTLMEPHTWPCKSRTTSTNIHSAAMCRYGMLSWRPT